MGNRVVHFEIEAKDVKGLKKFYTDAFGWKMEQMDAKYGDYVVVTTGDSKEAGGINGGIYTTPGKKKEVNAFRCVVAVDNIEKAAEDVEKAGGKILTKNKKADNIPGVGLFLSCEDPEKNRFTLLQPSDDMAK